MIFRVAFDHHLHMESKLSVTAVATHLWLFLKVLNLVQTLRVFSTRMEQPFMRYYYVMITSAVELFKISRVLCSRKPTELFENTSAARSMAILGHWRG